MTASTDRAVVRKPRLVLLGKQGAGKGTQSARVAERYGIVHLSTGDMFRAAAKDGSKFGLEAKSYMDRGELVPDDVVVRVVEERLRSPELREAGFVLDGFPRTLPQAKELEEILDGQPLDVAVDLRVSTEIVLDRIAGRRVCESCGAVYHVNLPPTRPWICDVCGGRVVQREDDTEDAVLRRLELYEQETVPLIDYYGDQDRLIVVDGEGNSDEVFHRVVSALADRFGS